MNLLDCTLRDGANVVGNGFDAALTTSMIEALLRCGIEDIEFGNAKGMGAYEQLKSAAPLTDFEYMELVKPFVEKGRLGMFLLAKCAKDGHIRAAKDNGLAFIRVGADAGDFETAFQVVATVKAAGLLCRYSLMKGYVKSPEALAVEAFKLEEAGVDAITIMDSAGPCSRRTFPDMYPP